MGSWRWDLTSNAFVWSDECFRLFGFHPDDFAPDFGRYLDMLHPEYRGSLLAIIHELEHTAAFQSFEYRAYRADGEIRWMESHIALERGGPEGSAHVYGTVQDITEIRTLEHELRTRKAQLEDAERVAQMGSWFYELETGRFSWSRSLPEMCELDPERFEPAFETLLELAHPDDRPQLDAIRQRVMGGESPLECEHRMVTPTGRRLVIVSRLELMDAGRAGSRIVGTARNVTSEREAQRLTLIKDAKLREADRLESVGRLAGGVAHEFNNLLTVILNYAVIAKGDAQENAPVDEPLLEIIRASKVASQLTQGLLTFSRRDPDGPWSCSPNEVIGDMERLIGHAVGERISLEVSADPDVGWAAIGADELRQIIWNLIINASDAMPDGGTLTLRTLKGDPPGEFVRIEVSDTGEGMSPEVARMAFEPFFTTKPPGKGTGLGLATVYGRVTQVNGEVKIQTAPGNGTSVEVDLPSTTGQAEPPEAAQPQPPEQPLEGNDRLVLVVEDNRQLGQLTCEMLRRAHYRCLYAADGDTALFLCAEHAGELELVLTDLVMPGVSGAQLATEIRERWPTVQIVYVSGYLDRVTAAGLDRPVLNKPFNPPNLLKAVATALAPDGDKGDQD